MCTPVCWSQRPLWGNPDNRTVIHMQGYDYGKPGHTLCGVSYMRVWWDFETHDYAPADFNDCRRCMAVYRRIAKEKSQ